jgi:hypothetical protein
MKNTVRKWIKGTVAAFVGGGSSAVVSTLTTVVIAPDKFNPTTQLGNFLGLAGATFIVGAITHLFMYLQQNPVPPDDTTIFTKDQTQPKP